MRTLILERPTRFVRADTPEPGSPGAGEALVRVRRVGICGTDLHAFRGRQPFFSYPRILGHELGVEVVEVGAGVTGVAPGDRCAVEPYLECGSCGACRQGRTNCCYELRVLGVHVDGGMRELIVVPAHKLHRSASLSVDELALVETLGIGAHAVDRAQLREGEDALVVGAGPIGLAVIQFAVITGARVHVLELDARRRAFARERFGVASAFGPDGDPLAAIRGALGGELPAVVLDATGNPRSMHDAFRYLPSAGRLVLVGLFQGEVTFDDPEFHRRELTVLASRNSVSADFRRIVDLMEQGVVDPDPWITHRAGYDRLVEEFDGWLDPAGGVLKAMLEL